MSFAHFHCCTFSVVSVILFITCRWQPVSWLASHNLISTWITISCVCFLFCFHSPPLHYMFLLTLVPAVQPHLPRHPVWTCAALHLLACPSPYLYPTYKTCSSEQPVRVQHLQFPSSPVHLTPEIHTTICSLYLINYFHIPNVYSDIWSDTQSV